MDEVTGSHPNHVLKGLRYPLIASPRSRTEGEQQMRKHTIAAMGAFLAILVATGIAAAAKPSSSLSLVVGASSPSATVQPSYGSDITFNVTTTETDQPYVNVRCYQGTAFVYDGWGFFAGGAQPAFTLSSMYWTGGAADCTARLLYFDKQGRQRTLASLDFQVSG
jgi:hypothetical protein